VLYNAVFDSLYIEGLCYKTADSTDLALERFLECEKIDSKNAALSFELSKVYLAKADSVNALSYLKKAYSLDKENYFYAIALAEFYDDSKDYASAIKIYEKTYKRFPIKKNLLYFLARCYALNGEINKSIKVLDKLENRVGQNKMISVEKSRLYIYDNKHKKAIKVIDDLIKKYPIDADLYVIRGDIKREIKNNDEALEDYNKALELDPGCAGAQMSLCSYYSDVYNLDQMEHYALMILANESVSFQEKTRFIDFALKLYQNRPDYIEKIDQIFDTVIKANPESTEALLMYANILNELNNTEKMLEVLYSAVLLDEKCLTCHQQLIATVVYTEETDVLKVQQLVEQALKHFPEDAYLLFVEGSIYLTGGDELSAFEYYKKAVENVSAQSKLSEQIYLALSGMHIPEAMMFTREGIHLYPQNLMLLNNYAYNVAVYWAKNKEYMSEAKLSEFQGILDEAEKISESTVKADAINPYYLDTYAYILFLQGKYNLAKFYLEQALNYDKEANYEVLEHYGDVLNALGEKEIAVKYWEAAYLLNQTEELSNKIKQYEK
jgi:tetratricopeptide (TPR) repeat protein